MPPKLNLPPTPPSLYREVKFFGITDGHPAAVGWAQQIYTDESLEFFFFLWGHLGARAYDIERHAWLFSWADYEALRSQPQPAGRLADEPRSPGGNPD